MKCSTNPAHTTLNVSGGSQKLHLHNGPSYHQDLQFFTTPIIESGMVGLHGTEHHIAQPDQNKHLNQARDHRLSHISYNENYTFLDNFDYARQLMVPPQIFQCVDVVEPDIVLPEFYFHRQPENLVNSNFLIPNESLISIEYFSTHVCDFCHMELEKINGHNSGCSTKTIRFHVKELCQSAPPGIFCFIKECPRHKKTFTRTDNLIQHLRQVHHWIIMKPTLEIPGTDTIQF
ncbi:hypothetical protein EDC01DRAFT_675288, partial [Geopyxis carbonaria]